MSFIGLIEVTSWPHKLGNYIVTVVRSSAAVCLKIFDIRGSRMSSDVGLHPVSFEWFYFSSLTSSVNGSFIFVFFGFCFSKKKQNLITNDSILPQVAFLSWNTGAGAGKGTNSDTNDDSATVGFFSYWQTRRGCTRRQCWITASKNNKRDQSLTGYDWFDRAKFRGIWSIVNASNLICTAPESNGRSCEQPWKQWRGSRHKETGIYKVSMFTEPGNQFYRWGSWADRRAVSNHAASLRSV